MNGLTNMPNVAIVGRPNVGKSALFNRLLRRKIAIVHDQPELRATGFPRFARVAHGLLFFGIPGDFCAGESGTDQAGSPRRREAFRDSDLLLFVVDAKEGLSPIMTKSLRACCEISKPGGFVITTIDNDNTSRWRRVRFVRLRIEVLISAEHDRGILDLLDAVNQLLPPSPLESQFTSVQSLAVAILGRPNVGKSSLINSIVTAELAM